MEWPAPRLPLGAGPSHRGRLRCEFQCEETHICAAQRKWRGDSWGKLELVVGWCGRNREGEGRALVGVCGGGDLSTVGVCNLADEGKPDSVAAPTARLIVAV